MTKTESVSIRRMAASAVLPWRSVDSGVRAAKHGRPKKTIPQVEIDFCLEHCPYSDLEDCPDECKGYRGGLA